MEDGFEFVARAEYDYCSGQYGDLAFEVNDIILITQFIDENWLEGRLVGDVNQRKGIFPSNFITRITVPEDVEPSQRVLCAVADFPAPQSGDLGFRKGQIILGTKQLDGNWWEGRLLDIRGKSTAAKGIFPSNFVAPVPPPSQGGGKQNNPRLAIVVKDLKAQLNEEIDLIKGEKVWIMEVVDKLWYRGKTQDGTRKGIFPKGFVEISSTPSPQTQSSSQTTTPIAERHSGPGPGFGDNYFSTPSAADQEFDNRYSTGSYERPTEAPSGGDGERGAWLSGPPPDVPPPALPPELLEISTSEDTSPYGRTLYTFKAECVGELGFSEGEIVKLNRHVDDEWTEGESNGKVGIFPTSYVDIIVDCPAAGTWTSSTTGIAPAHFYDSGYGSSSEFCASIPDTIYENEPKDERMVLYDFTGSVSGDLSAKAAEMVVVVKEINPDWLEAVHVPSRKRGIIPAAYIERKRSRPLSGTSESPSVSWQSSSGSMVVSQSIDESIMKKVTSISPQFNRKSYSQEKPSIPSSSSYLSGSTYAGAVSQLARASTISGDSDVFITPPNSAGPSPTPEGPYCLPPSVSPPPRPKTSPAVKKEVDPAELERQRREAEEATKRKMKDQRVRIFQELLRSERDFLRDLESCQKAVKRQAKHVKSGVDPSLLTHGFPEVANVSRDMIHAFEMEQEKDFDSQVLGGVFLHMLPQFRTVYQQFWEASEEAVLSLDKLEHGGGVGVVKEILETMRKEGVVFMDMTAALTRPVHRILKYPLFLSELLKCTGESHVDKTKLDEALRSMMSLAQEINEAKRRKDLVLKYRRDGESSLSERLSKITLHSFKKKSSRFGVRLTTTIGLTHLVRDEVFEAAERDFRTVEKCVRHFIRDLQAYCEQLQHGAMQQQSLVESWRDVLRYSSAERSSVGNVDLPPELAAYSDAWRKVVETDLPKFFQQIRERVREPLNELNVLFHGPDNLIGKRRDKLLDYEAASGRAEQRYKAGELTKHQLAQDVEKRAQKEYEAMNSHLCSQLPKLNFMAFDVFRTCLRAFTAAQRNFFIQLRHSLHHLEENRRVSQIYPNFEARYRKATTELLTLSTLQTTKPFMSLSRKESVSQPQTTFENRAGSVRGSQRFKSYLKTGERGKIEFPKQPQTDAERNSLRGRVSNGKGLFTVLEEFSGQGEEQLELSVSKEDLVLALILKDPMGNSERWYVDNGITKGFVPRAILSPVALTSTTGTRPPLLRGPHTASLPPSVKRQASVPLIDLASPTETHPQQPSHQSDLTGLDFAPTSPLMTALQEALRPLPPAPPPHSTSTVVHKRSAPLPPRHARSLYVPPTQPPPQHMGTGASGRTGSTALPMPNYAYASVSGTTPLYVGKGPAPQVPIRPMYQNVGYDDDFGVEVQKLERELRHRKPTPKNNASMKQGNKNMHNNSAKSIQQDRKNGKINNTRTPVRSAPPPPKHGQDSHPHPQQSEAQNEPLEFFVSQYDLSTTDPNELSVGRGQVVLVHMKQDLEGNPEWWLCEEEEGGIGYVPANYLRPYNPS